MSTVLQNLQNSLDPLRRRYDSMADSERLVVNGIGVLIVLVLLFLILILPGQRAVDKAQTSLTAKQNLLSWMQDNEQLARMAAQGGSRSSRSDQPLQSIVTSTAPALGITVKRIEPESDDKLRVWLEKVSFDKTVRWLHQIETRYGVRIVNASIDAERAEGLVTAKLVLQK